jgi:hypothetical protein
MLLPLIVAFIAVALGAAIAILPREGTRIVKPLRLIAFVAAVFVIATHLLPEAVHELGLRALVAFALGTCLPWLMDLSGTLLARLRGAAPGSSSLAALELSYAGLVVHRFGDGLSMGAIARSQETPSAALTVLLALAAHIVPVTTVMVLAFVSLKGRPTALIRASGLAVATMGGVLVAGFALEQGPKDVSPWVSALVAGLLLHLVLPAIPWRSKTPEPGHGKC